MLPRRLSTGVGYTPSGAMQHRVNILQPTTQQDTFGGIVEPVSFATDIWAAVQTLSGRELINAQQIVAEVTHKITIRYLPGVKAKMLVAHDGRVFQIQYVQDADDRMVELQLICLERNDAAYGV